MSELFVYVTTHQHSRVVCSAFAAGAGAALVGAFRLQPTGDAAVYGRFRGCDRIIAAAIEHRRSWYYIDRGYIHASRGADYSGYFRVTRNAFQVDGTGEPNFARLAALRVPIAPWRTDGEHVLVCPPGDVFARLQGFDSQKWEQRTLDTLRAHTDRPIRVRRKPRNGERNPPLAHDLARCHAVVTHSGNVAVDALLAGVPAFVAERCAAWRCASRDLSTIERPACPDDRHEWAAALAGAQWTLDEMQAGDCWRALRRTP